MSLLPSETIGQIIFHLQDDTQSLIACSLAASTFIAFTRGHLFSEVSLDVSNVCKFLEILDVPWCTVHPAVKRMVIRDHKRIQYHGDEVFDFVPKDRSRIISRLQGIQSIRFRHVSLGSVPPPFWRLLQNLGGVKELEIHHMTFEKPAHFFQYVCSLPALEALSISKSRLETIPSDLSQYRPHSSFCIPWLDMDRLSPGILDWFMAQVPPPPVHTLCISLERGAMDVMSHPQYVEVLGPSVRNLRIKLPSHTRLQALDISMFTEMRSLRLEGSIQLGNQDSCYFDNLRHIFKQLTSSALGRVSLKVSLVSCSEAFAFIGIPDGLLFQTLPWAEIPHMLSTVECRTFALAVSGLARHEWKEVERFLRTGPLSDLEKKEMLCINFL